MKQEFHKHLFLSLLRPPSWVAQYIWFSSLSTMKLFIMITQRMHNKPHILQLTRHPSCRLLEASTPSADPFVLALCPASPEADLLGPTAFCQILEIDFPTAGQYVCVSWPSQIRDYPISAPFFPSCRTDDRMNHKSHRRQICYLKPK